jgi:hypothetical protein
MMMPVQDCSIGCWVVEEVNSRYARFKIVGIMLWTTKKPPTIRWQLGFIFLIFFSRSFPR